VTATIGELTPIARDAPPHPELTRGDTVDRYVVLDRIGAGGMGVVYAAYDPKLDRRVALKLLRSKKGGSAGRARLLMEAQALAKLAHPNVVAVFDVGAVGDQVWIAMEYVEGEPFSVWIRERSRRWPAVLAVLTKVAEGLAAAHKAGLVHRDVKPDNVMIDRDGDRPRVRLMDFGLARTSAGDTTGSSSAELSSSAALEATRAGRAAGTPGYMAPEQHLRLVLDARTDEFSWCVMAWEALYRERPYGGDLASGLVASVIAGNLRTPPSNADVPRWLRAILQRGLARAPSERYPSMAALLDAIAHGQSRARARRIVGVAAIGGALVLSGFGVGELAHARKLKACATEAARIDEVWNEAAAASVHDAIVRSGSPHALDTAVRLTPWIDDAAASWRSAREEACVRTIEAQWSAADDERATACLVEQRWALEGLLAALAEPSREVVDRAIHAAVALPDVAACLDEQLLARRPALPDDPDERAHIEGLRRGLARARSLESAGRYPEADAIARTTLERAQQIGWAPLVAEAWLRRGAAELKRAKYEEAERSLTESYFVAIDAAADAFALEAAAKLILVVGYRQARYDDGVLWGRHAESLLAQQPEQPLRAVAVWGGLGLVAYARGDYDEAAAHHERALAVVEATLGRDHLDVTPPLSNLALVEFARADWARAHELHVRALAIDERTLGPSHPAVAVQLTNLANLEQVQGRPAEAVPLYQRALAIDEQSLGADHPDTLTVLSNLGAVQTDLGNLHEAETLLLRAIAARERKLGREHPDLATSHNALGLVYSQMRHWDDARAQYERALAIGEEALGPDHPMVASVLESLAHDHVDRGDYEAALPLYERAAQIRETALGSDHVDGAIALHGMGLALLGLGRNAEAIAPLERAVALRERNPVGASLLAETKAALARARE
jgi:tetratricopeptide (TPR) repeat protein